MMMRSIADVLVDFQQRGPAPSMPSFAMPTVPSEPEVDVEALVLEAEERGYARGRADAMEEHQAEASLAEAANSDHANELLEQARAHWAAEESERLAAKLDEALDQVKDLIADKVAVILQAMMAPALRQQMLEQLNQAIETLTRHDSTMLLRIEGPSDLVEALRKSLAGRVRSVDLVAGEGLDVRVSAHDSVIESHLRAWLEISEERNA